MEVVPDLWRRRRQRQQRKRPRRIHPHAPNMSQTHSSGGPRQATWLDLFYYRFASYTFYNIASKITYERNGIIKLKNQTPMTAPQLQCHQYVLSIM